MELYKMKIPKWINNRLPMSRKEYLKDMKAMWIVINALKQDMSQHAQVEMNLLKTVSGLQANAKPKNGKRADAAYQ